MLRQRTTSEPRSGLKIAFFFTKEEEWNFDEKERKFSGIVGLVGSLNSILNYERSPVKNW